MKVRVIATLVLALCLAACTGSASSIATFFAQDGSDCDGSLPAFDNTAGYFVCAVLGGDAAAAGITGAEFRIVGHSGVAQWTSPNPQANPASNISLIHA